MKVIKIDNCARCPYSELEKQIYKFCCRRSFYKRIKNIKKIADCRLKCFEIAKTIIINRPSP